MTLDFNLTFIKWKSYTKFQLNMSKHIEEKCGKLCISSIPNTKRGITPTKIDDTRTWSDVHWQKVIYKISAQYAKACRGKVQKTVYFQYFKFQIWSMSPTKTDANWRHSKFIYSTVKQNYAQFHLYMSKHLGKKYRKLCIYSIISSKRGITPNLNRDFY